MSTFQVLSVLRRLGEDIKTARKRRNLSVADFCERIGVTDKTLTRLERGDGGVRLEVFVSALHALGEIARLETLLDPKEDEVGLLLDRSRLPERIRKRRTSGASVPTAPSATFSGSAARIPADSTDDEGSSF
jgi:transcriptional regulator with XRE-family HTH domain